MKVLACFTKLLLLFCLVIQVSESNIALAGKKSKNTNDWRKYGPGFDPACMICQQHAWDYEQKKKKKKKNKVMYTVSQFFSPGSQYTYQAPAPHQHVYGRGGYHGTYYGNGNAYSQPGSYYGNQAYPSGQYHQPGYYPGYNPGLTGSGSYPKKSKKDKKNKKYGKKKKNHSYYTTYAIHDQYRSPGDVMNAVVRSGVEFNLIVALDSSVLSSSGHFGQNPVLNEFKHALSVFSSTIGLYDRDQIIPSYIYGQPMVRSGNVLDMTNGMEFNPWGATSQRTQGLVGATDLNAAFDHFTVSSQSRGASPAFHSGSDIHGVLEQALNVVRETGQYHILIIFSAHDIDDRSFRKAHEALALASRYPLSVITVGVGQGPFYRFHSLDDDVSVQGFERVFDNFQFVSYQQVSWEAQSRQMPVEAVFMRESLSEIPAQYHMIRDGQQRGAIFRFNSRPGFWKRQFGGAPRPYYAAP